jgi:lactate dehydrogenase-like 2-hydroxyacid dehydrogenase
MPDKPAIFVARKLPDVVEARLQRDYRADLNETDRLYSPEELLEKSQDADALLISGRYKISARMIEQLPDRMRAIATYSVGYDHIDLTAASKRHIQVVNTPDVLTDATAELTWLLILGAARRAYEGEQLVRDARWQPSSPDLLGTQVTGKRLGIFGMGRIGQAVAQRARAFKMDVHYHNRHRLASEDEQGAIFHDTIADLLRVSDIFSLHCPATPETKEFLNADRIALLPDGAIVINAARGSLVVDQDLIAAVRSGKLKAIGLDVYAGEPDHINPGYRTLPNAFLLPHLGSATVETRTQMGFVILDNLDAIFAGQTPPNLLNPQVNQGQH